MSRDYRARKIIIDNSSSYKDENLTSVLVRTFDIMCRYEEPNGCLSNSIALYVILRSMGYDPKLCYGLCVLPNKQEIYHAWLELDGRILDVSIYGNSHFSPLWPKNEDLVDPVIFVPYDEAPFSYGDHVFDDDWGKCLISQAVKFGNIQTYINNAPGNGMWKLIFSILNETYTSKRLEELRTFASGDLA